MNYCFGCYLNGVPTEKLMDDDFINERLDEFYPFEEYHGEFPLCLQCTGEVLMVMEILDE